MGIWKKCRGMLVGGALSVATSAAFALSPATDYPVRTVKIVLPLAVGSSGDLFTRFFAERITAALGQPFIVENVPGANGIPAASAVMRAPADGYTLLQGTSAVISLNPILLKKLDYDAVNDLKPVAGLIRTAQIIAVPASSPFQTLEDLLAAARQPGAFLNSATYGPLYLLAQEWFASLAGVRFNNIAYKGAAAAAADLAGGQVDMGFVDIAGVNALVKAGRVRVLAVTSEQRVPELPDTPTFRERGFPTFVSYAWASLFVRSGTPDSVVDRIAGAVLKAHASDEAKAFLMKSPGVQLMPFGPAEMRKFQLQEIERLQAIAKSAGIEPQ